MSAGSDEALWRKGVAELQRLLRSGEVTPLDLLDLAHKRVARINPAINAVVAINPEAEDAARDSTERLRRGEGRGPLEGIPITVKDNIPVRGLPATWGSKIFRDYRPVADELPVARLRAAGAVILGKTNVPELTLEGYTGNPLFGTTRNPWNIDLTPGGSSGGAVASVAAGLVPVAIGTDGGGSIRRPASHTGLVGLKPSTGWVARHDGFPAILLDFEVIGPIARSVEDAAFVLDAMAGPDRRDRKSLFARDVCRVSEDLGAPPAPLRVRYARKVGEHPLDPQIAHSVDRAAETFAALGHEVTDGPLPFDIMDLNQIWLVFAEAAVGYVMDRHPEGRRLMAPKFVEMAERGRAISASRYLDALERVDRFRRVVAVAYQGLDVIMTPSAAALPWPADEAYPAEIDGQAVGPRGHAVYTGWVNACGHPGISLPSTPAEDGLPIGFQLVGDFGADALLFRLAAQYERAQPWRHRWPAIGDLTR